MILEDDMLLDFTSGISEDEVSALLEKCKNTNEPLPPNLKELLLNQKFFRYFKFHLDQYCEFFGILLINITNSEEVVLLLKHESSFQKVIRQQDGFHEHFLTTLLPVLIEVYCKHDDDEKLFEEISKVIYKGIFSLKEFESYLPHVFERKKVEEKHSICKSFFKFLPVLSGSPQGFKLIFHSFAKTFKNFDCTYKMFIVLLEIIGFELKESFNFKLKHLQPEPSLQTSLEIVNSLLEVTSTLKLESDCKINDITFSDFLKNLLKSIIALTEQPNVTCYKILLNIIEINPLIIESLINETLIYVMLSDKTQLKVEYENLMIKILEVFSKLHRIQNFIAKMIPTLKSFLENPQQKESVYNFRGISEVPTHVDTSHKIEDILPCEVLNYFTDCIVNLASWQVINLFKTVLFHLGKVVEDLPEEKNPNYIYIEMLATLTCQLLLSVRIAEHTVTQTTVTKFVGGLDQLKTILGNFGTTLLQRKHDHVMMKSFLNVCLHWAEIYLTLDYYSINKEIKMSRTPDCYDLTYLHPYLSVKQWCHIQERINNFGEIPCKEIMQKLMIQKLKALVVSNTENPDDLVGILCSEMNFLDVLSDRFVVKHVLDRMPHDKVVELCEAIVSTILEGKDEILLKVSDSVVITQGIIGVIFVKINKLMKHKKKQNDVKQLSKIVSLLSNDSFLNNNVIDGLFTQISEIIVEDNNETFDLSLQQIKIATCLSFLTKVPIIFCPQSIQKLTLLCLFGLRQDLSKSNCEEELVEKCESLIFGIIQHSKFTLLDFFEPSVLLNLLNSCKRSCDLFSLIAQNIFKNDECISQFAPGISLIKDNLKNRKFLEYSVIILNIINKIRKTKLTAESKSICQTYKTDLCHKLSKLILKNPPEDHLMEPFTLTLKASITKDTENEQFAKLKRRLNDYLAFSFDRLPLLERNDGDFRGYLLLFITILHNKNVVMGDLAESSDLIVRIWDSLRNVRVTNENFGDYAQLIMLITTLVENEKLGDILGELLGSVDTLGEFSNNLKTWQSIVATNFNPIKTGILRSQLEFLSEKIVKIIRAEPEKINEIVEFQTKLIQTAHVPLTSSLIDHFFLTITLLMLRKETFLDSFTQSIGLLENLLKHRRALIMDRLPPFLLQYRLLLKELCFNSGSKSNLKNDDLQKLADCAHRFEKLTKNLTENTKDMTRISMYLVADILAQYEVDVLYPNVKKHLDNSIYALISLCDQHAVQYLMRVLNNASTEMFKIMFDHYKKYYKFTGKV